jgi:plastocyanin
MKERRRDNYDEGGFAVKKLLFFLLALYGVSFVGLAQAGTIVGKAKVQGKQDHQNIVVYVDGATGDFQLPSKRPELNHINLSFQPPVLAVLKGTIVDFPNSDPVFHSAFSISPSNPFDLGLYQKGREKFVHFKNPGVVEVFCHIHSHMHAYVLALDNPYFAVTEADGTFTIANVPDGNYTLKAWLNPSVVIAKPVSVQGKQTVNLDFTLVAER